MSSVRKIVSQSTGKGYVCGFSPESLVENIAKPGFIKHLLDQIGGEIPTTCFKDRNAVTFPNGNTLNEKWFVIQLYKDEPHKWN